MKSLVAILTSLVCLFSSSTGLFAKQVESVSTIRKIDDSFYTMDYTFEYDIDEILRRGNPNTVELVLHGLNTVLNGAKGFACTTFNSVTPSGDYLFSRNFDYMDASYLLLRTTPKNGYASISSVSLEFLGYFGNMVPDSDLTGIMTLLAPYVPLDGINEKGLSIGVLELEKNPLFQISLKKDLTTTTVIRAVLDKAATVDEAIEIFRNHDIRDFLFGGCTYHYQIADASGKSVVIEYVDGKMNILEPIKAKENKVDYIAATNFYLTDGVYDPDGMGYDRYETVTEALKASKGVTTEKEAMKLLKAVSMKDKDLHGYICSTLWSVVYNCTDRTVNVVHYLDYDNVYSFSLSKPLHDQVK